MADALNLMIRIGPVALLAGLLVSVAVAAFGFARGDADRLKWLGRYLLGMLLAGVIALFVGAGLGIAVFCSSAKAGNLCGLGGLFGTGPLLAGIALAVHAWRRMPRAGGVSR